MLHLSLRSKIALLAVVSCAVALAGGAVSAWFSLHRTEMQQLDASLQTGAQEFFRDLENFDGLRREQRTEITDRFVPPSLRACLIELSGRHGELIFRSENLGTTSLMDAPPGFTTRTVNGSPRRLGVFMDEDLRLVVAGDFSEIRRMERNLGIAVLTALPVVVIIIALAGGFLARRALQPVDELTRAAEQITAARLGRRLPEPRARDEIHRLVVVLNSTFERLQRSFEQATRFSADASHQLRTPLAVLRAGLDTMLQSPHLHDEDREIAMELLDQIRRLVSLTEDLLLLARADGGRLQLKLEPRDLRTILDDCLDDTRALAETRDIAIDAPLPDRIEAIIDAGRVSVILQKLLQNALKYNRAGGRIRVAAAASDGSIEVRVGNSGEAIPGERQSHVFERFARGLNDERLGGNGLGLSLARELARAHGGELELVKSDADWTEFVLRLPTAPPAS